jgi:hypothetical protein
MRKTIVLAALLAAAASFSGSAAAQQFKWVDQNGKVQYGDTPPPGVKATRMQAPASGSAPAPAPASGKSAAKTPPLSPEAAFKKRQQEAQEAEEKAQKDKLAADTRKSNCTQAQNQLAAIRSGQRIQTTNAAGERVFADDAGRAQEEQRTQAAVNEWCK